MDNATPGHHFFDGGGERIPVDAEVVFVDGLYPIERDVPEE